MSYLKITLPESLARAIQTKRHGGRMFNVQFSKTGEAILDGISLTDAQRVAYVFDKQCWAETAYVESTVGRRAGFPESTHVSSEVHPEPIGTTNSYGDRRESTPTPSTYGERGDNILAAFDLIDGENSEHWNADRTLPSLAAIADISSVQDIGPGELEHYWREYNASQN